MCLKTKMRKLATKLMFQEGEGGGWDLYFTNDLNLFSYMAHQPPPIAVNKLIGTWDMIDKLSISNFLFFFQIS